MNIAQYNTNIQELSYEIFTMNNDDFNVHNIM